MGLFEHFPYLNLHELNLDWIVNYVKGVKAKTDVIDKSVQTAVDCALESEAWAKGTEDDTPVDSDAPQYHNNASYWSSEAHTQAINADLARIAADASAHNAAGSALSAKNYADNIADPVSGIVANWLTDHITNPSNPPVDTSLMVAGAAADALVTGNGLRALTPTIVRIQDNIYGTNGGIYFSTKIHRNSTGYRRTNTMYYVQNGQKIGAYLSATRDYLVIAFYSAAAISEANFVDGVRGKTGDHLNYYEFTAPQDGYIVFTTQATVLDGSCAFILNDYRNGDELLKENSDRIKNLAGGTNKIIKELLRPNTTIGATGVIGTKAGDVISNKIFVSGGDVLSVHATNIAYLSINVYDATDTFLGRAEYTTAIIPPSGDFFVCTPIGAGAHYAIVCMTVLDAYYNVVAFIGNTPEIPFDVAPLSPNDQSAFVEVAAHRGYTLGYPENTDISTKQARIHNFKAVENDVRFTSDGIAVLLHDPEINRTARNLDGTTIGSTINIDSITYAQCSNYDFGVYAGAQFAGTPIGTLENQLSLCKKLGLELWIEPKVSGHASDIVNMVKKAGMLDHVSFIGFSATILAEIAALLPNATLMLARSTFNASYLAECISLKTSTNKVFAYINYSNPLTSTDINSCITAGIDLAYYTVDNYNSAPLLQDYCTRMCSTYYRSDMIITEETLAGS